MFHSSLNMYWDRADLSRKSYRHDPAHGTQSIPTIRYPYVVCTHVLCARIFTSSFLSAQGSDIPVDLQDKIIHNNLHLRS